MNKTQQFRYEVLKILQDAFIDLGVAAILREPDGNFPFHRLNTLHDDMGLEDEEVMGEFYFMPLEEENLKFHLFNIVFTITENMPKDKQEELGRAATHLNFYLPVGAFIFDMEEDILAFKYSALVPVETNAEKAVDMLDGSISLSLRMVGKFYGAFLDLMNEDITFQQFLELIPR